MNKILILFTFLVIFKTNAQNPALQSVLNFGSYAGGVREDASVVTDANGNVFVMGSFYGIVDFDPSPAVQNVIALADANIYLVKYNSAGAFVWGKVIAGTNITPKSFVIDNAGNMYIRGDYLGLVDFDPSPATGTLNSGLSSSFLAKYDASGNYLWAKDIIGSGDYVKSFAVDNAGNIVISGAFVGTEDFDPSASTTNLTAVGGRDVYFAKYNSYGNFVWAKQISCSTTADFASGITLAFDNANNLILTGVFDQIADFDPSAAVFNITTTTDNNLFYAKYNSSGDFVFAKKIGGNAAGSTLQKPFAIKIDNLGNFYLTGFYNDTVDFDPSAGVANLISDGATRNNAFFAKYDAIDGHYIWAKQIGGSSTVNDEGYDITLDNSGNVVITGKFAGTVDFDPSAAIFNLTSVQLSAFNYPSDVYLAKYDVSGNFIWAKNIGGTSHDEGRTLGIDNSGNIILSGKFQGIADFDPSAAVYTLTSNFSTPYYSTSPFFSKYSSSGSLVYAFSPNGPAPSGGADAGEIVKFDNAGNLYFTPSFTGTVDFDPSAGVANFTSIANTKLIIKYDAAGNYLWGKQFFVYTYYFSYNIDGLGNIFIAGDFTGTVDFDLSTAVANFTSNGASDIFIAKYDANGNYLWAKIIGGVDAESCSQIKLDNTGNIFITGGFYTTTDFDPSAITAFITSSNGGNFVAKYNSLGNFLMAVPVSRGDNIGGYLVTSDMEIDATGNIFLGGRFWHSGYFNPANNGAYYFTSSPTSNDFDGFIAKYSPTGVYQWVTRFNTNSDDRVNDIVLDNAGNVYGAGLLNLKSNYPQPTTSSVLFAKFDNNGVIQWGGSISGSGYSNGNSLSIDNSSNIFLAGSFRTDLSFITGTADDLLGGNNTAFLAKYTTAGTYISAYSLGGNSGASINSMAINTNEDFVMTGSYAGTVDFDLVPTTVSNLVNFQTDYNIFLAKYSLTLPYETITTTGNWNANATWNTNTPPTATKTAKINSTHTVNIPNTGNQVKTIQMSGGNINLTGGTLEIKNQ
jgi:hypothetical protein